MNQNIKTLAEQAGLSDSLGAEALVALLIQQVTTIIYQTEKDTLAKFTYMGDSPPGFDYVRAINKHFLGE